MDFPLYFGRFEVNSVAELECTQNFQFGTTTATAAAAVAAKKNQVRRCTLANAFGCHKNEAEQKRTRERDVMHLITWKCSSEAS